MPHSPVVLVAATVLLAACGGPTPPPTGPSPRLPVPVPERLRYEPMTPSLPAIPETAGALDIRVVHPTPTTPRPRVDSAYVYGSVGRGDAALSINGRAVPVAANGAFLAFLPMPADGVWRLTAHAGGGHDTQDLAYAPPPAATGAAATPAGGAPSGVFASPSIGVVTGGSDTLATGSDAIYARPTPTGTYRWFFPRGARLSVVERRGDQYRVQLDPATSAWINTSAVSLDPPGATPPSSGIAVVRPVAGGYEVRMPVLWRPFLVEAGDTSLSVTVYGPRPAGGLLQGALAAGETYVRGFGHQPVEGGVVYSLSLASAPWGYRAWYEEDGDLVLRVRRPPDIDAAQPLRGRRIVVDPGHPPGGATGPTGLTEAEANLAIATRLAEKLRARGAEVHMTRTTMESVELAPRAEMALRLDAELFVSVHNNAFGEGVNPFRNHGTSTYSFHPFSAPLARALDREIAAVTGIPDLGAKFGNFAVIRPTWYPSALTESLFMLIPEQEAALRDPAFLDRLAEAHARGIEAFLRERAEGQR
ncbi:MAG TPA: N-acetylmuramoyl-L-alanine amidase [Longimicrobium sp.]|nr:N-acetylmuramoyl-L-alanine amidase [Longimicrobium sp.]